MRLTKRKKESIAFPITVFETADTKEDFEDWLLSQNPQFIKKMRKQDQSTSSEKGEAGNL
jgi:hypothetical protein